MCSCLVSGGQQCAARHTQWLSKVTISIVAHLCSLLYIHLLCDSWRVCLSKWAVERGLNYWKGQLFFKTMTAALPNTVATSRMCLFTSKLIKRKWNKKSGSSVTPATSPVLSGHVWLVAPYWTAQIESDALTVASSIGQHCVKGWEEI